MVLKFNIEMTKQTESLFLFIGEVHRLSRERKSFIFCFNYGQKLFLKTCNGLQKKLYICTREREEIDPLITTLNYCVALQSELTLSLYKNTLIFEIASPHIKKIQSFADSLDVKYQCEL